MTNKEAVAKLQAAGDIAFAAGCELAKIPAMDVLAIADLLTEQEPTTYAYDEYITPTCQTCGFHPFIAYIPTLERMEQKGYNYCPGCGRRIKWNA